MGAETFNISSPNYVIAKTCSSPPLLTTWQLKIFSTSFHNNGVTKMLSITLFSDHLISTSFYHHLFS
jgi:hypothetical protein